MAVSIPDIDRNQGIKALNYPAQVLHYPIDQTIEDTGFHVDQVLEFISNHLLLFGALVVVLVLLIKAELDHQATKGSLLSPAQAIRLMNNHDDALVIDVRTSAEYKAGHIKGARNMPLKGFEDDIRKLDDSKSSPVLLYCNTGNTVTRAVRQLQTAGFENINNLAGGIVAWKDASMPLTKK